MNNAFAVSVVERVAELFGERSKNRPGNDLDWRTEPQSVKRRSIHVFHSDEGVFAGVPVQIVDADNIGMAELPAAGGFAAEQVNGGIIETDLGRKEFKRDQ